MKSTKEHLKFYTKHTWKHIRKNKINCLGCLSAFLVVSISAMTITLLTNSPVIFLRLSEVEHGEYELEIKPSNGTSGKTLNYTKMVNYTQNYENNALDYSSPRMVSSVEVYPVSQCNLPNPPPENYNWTYLGFGSNDSCFQNSTGNGNCLQKYCALDPSQKHDGNLYLINTQLEKRMEFGRNWDYETICPGCCYFTSSEASKMKVNKGDQVILRIKLGDEFIPQIQQAMINAGLVNQSSNETTIMMDYDWTFLNIPLYVNEIVPDGDGKTENSASGVIYSEFDYFMKTAADHLYPYANASFVEAFRNIDLSFFADYVYFNHQPPRSSMYDSSNFDKIKTNFVGFVSKILYRIGFQNLDASEPLLSSLRGYRFFQLFLGLILTIIIAILIALSMILIYSLLLVSVETRTFEMAVMRTVGITKSGLIKLVIFQALFYALPAWATGLAFGQIFYLGIAKFFGNLIGSKIGNKLSPTAILISTALGILIPIFSSIYPIKLALEKNLVDSLNVRQSKTQGVKYKFERAVSSKIPAAALVIGISLSVYGFLIYYLFPLALLSFNLALLLNMFFWIIAALLFGLVILSLNIEYPIEKAIAYIFLIFNKTYVRTMVLKNLIAHRVRNRKTTIMYALSLGFIIFIAIQFNLQLTSVEYSIKQQNGCEMQILSGYGSSSHGIQRIRNISAFEDYASNNSKIKSFSWVSQDLALAIGNLNYANLSIPSRVELFSYSVQIMAVSPNLLDITKDQFLDIDTDIKEMSDTMNVIDQLYTIRGSSSALIGTLYKNKLDLTVNDIYVLYTTGSSNGKDYLNITTLRPISFLSSCPIATMSKLPSVSLQTIFVSFYTYLQLSQQSIHSIEEIPMQRFLLEFEKTIDFQNGTKITYDDSLTVWDFRDSVKPFAIAKKIMNAFFIFSIIMSNIICFFALVSSMRINIFEQTIETGILRAIGFSKRTIIFVFIAEAFVLIFSSSIIGFIIGLIVAYTMYLQNALFMGFSVPFSFPYTILLVILACSFVFAFLAAFFPARSLLKKPVTEILRTNI
ncbi:hypothetical protein M0811_01663 [Anaeramoeba ignava]|uniref:ABC3 transporter permease C-terminal domain-containing protein n=1 Tax=Anaeramoeba ignava TaxID=1746090 RepID=A0A9Q0LH38_ANAIG|nr:hypothetical protein M0811_01663 [Anaeramoeba ignava]